MEGNAIDNLNSKSAASKGGSKEVGFKTQLVEGLYQNICVSEPFNLSSLSACLLEFISKQNIL